MKVLVAVLLALLAMGITVSFDSSIRSLGKRDAKVEGQKKKWKSTFYPAGITRPFQKSPSLGTAATYTQFREALVKSMLEKDKVWQTIYQKQNDPFVVKLFKNGITHFSHSATLQADEGVRRADLNEYCDLVVANVGVSPSEQRKVREELELASYSAEGETDIISVVYPGGGKGHGRFLNMMVARDPQTREYDFVIINVTASFEIGPDIIAVTVTKKYFFGLIKKRSTVYIKKEAELNKETIELVFDFFKLAALEKLHSFLK